MVPKIGNQECPSTCAYLMGHPDAKRTGTVLLWDSSSGRLMGMVMAYAGPRVGHPQGLESAFWG